MRTNSFFGFSTYIAMAMFAAPCFGQSTDGDSAARMTREELCQKVLCREPSTVEVVLEDGRIMLIPFEDVSPIVLPNGWVTVLPGEDVHIAFDVMNGVIGNPRAITQPDASEHTLSFHFDQDAETAGSSLIVESTLDYAIKFDVGIMLPEDDKIRSTSSCPVLARKKTYERWPHPIFQIILARFRVLAPDSSMECK